MKVWYMTMPAAILSSTLLGAEVKMPIAEEGSFKIEKRDINCVSGEPHRHYPTVLWFSLTKYTNRGIDIAAVGSGAIGEQCEDFFARLGLNEGSLEVAYFRTVNFRYSGATPCYRVLSEDITGKLGEYLFAHRSNIVLDQVAANFCVQD